MIYIGAERLCGVMRRALPQMSRFMRLFRCGPEPSRRRIPQFCNLPFLLQSVHSECESLGKAEGALPVHRQHVRREWKSGIRAMDTE